MKTCRATYRAGAVLILTLVGAPALATEAGGARDGARSARRCAEVGYDPVKMEARRDACAEGGAAIAPAGAAGGYDPIAMVAIDGGKPARHDTRRQAEPDELTLRAWSGP